MMIPINYRYDSKVLYYFIGVFADYNVQMDTSDPNYTIWQTLNYVRKFNFGINLGVGIEKPINKYFNILVETRCIFNESSLIGFRRDPIFEPSGFYNLGFAIGVNYKFLN